MLRGERVVGAKCCAHVDRRAVDTHLLSLRLPVPVLLLAYFFVLLKFTDSSHSLRKPISVRITHRA